MSASILLSNASPDDPAWLQSIIDLLRPKLSLSGIAGAGDGVAFRQQAVPGPEQQGMIWHRLSNDVNGNPLGTYSYLNGRWCKEYPFPPGTLAFLNTTPVGFFNLTTGIGLFDGGTTGLAGEWYGWRLHLDGDTGNLRDRVLFAANHFNTSTNLWETKYVDGTFHERGGRTGSLLAANEQAPQGITGREYDSAATPGTPRVVVSTKTSGADVTTDPAYSGTANADQQKLTDYPPYAARGLLEFVGYVYTDPTVVF